MKKEQFPCNENVFFFSNFPAEFMINNLIFKTSSNAIGIIWEGLISFEFLFTELCNIEKWRRRMKLWEFILFDQIRTWLIVSNFWPFNHVNLDILATLRSVNRRFNSDGILNVISIWNWKYLSRAMISSYFLTVEIVRISRLILIHYRI